MSESIIQARPERVKISTMDGARYCETHFGLNSANILLDVRSLGKQPGKISVTDYFYYRLFDPEMPEDERRRFVGARLEQPLHKLIFDREASQLANDKCLFEATLLKAGLPSPETVCLYQGKPKGPSGQWATVSDSKALTAWLSETSEYPLYGKPRFGIRSGGVLALTNVNASTGMATTGPEAEHRLDTVVDQLGRYRRKGYLFQRRLQPHPGVAEVVGDVIATVRLIVLVGDSGPKVHRAAWKLPVAGSVADNFWRGNILAGVDRNTGEVVRAIRGTGLEMETVTKHPDSKKPLIGMAVPDWQQLVDLAFEASALFPGIDMQAWDIAVTDRGPVLMEINIGGDYNLPQLAHHKGMLDGELITFLERSAKSRGRSKAFEKLKLGQLA